MRSWFHFDAFAFALAWAALAVAGWSMLGWHAGVALSAGLFLIVMPSSALILSRTGSFGIERAVRWSVLAAAALATLVIADLAG